MTLRCQWNRRKAGMREIISTNTQNLVWMGSAQKKRCGQRPHPTYHKKPIWFILWFEEQWFASQPTSAIPPG
jgi:hypothetical protein